MEFVYDCIILISLKGFLVILVLEIQKEVNHISKYTKDERAETIISILCYKMKTWIYYFIGNSNNKN